MATARKQFVYKDSYGYRMTFTLDPNATGALSDTTDLLLRIKPPAGSVIEHQLTDENISDVSLGVVFYDVVPGDFAQEGDHFLEIIDVTPGRFIPAEIKKLSVKPIIEA